MIRLGSQGSSKVVFCEIITPSESDEKLDFHTNTHKRHVFFPRSWFCQHVGWSSIVFKSLSCSSIRRQGRYSLYSRYGMLWYNLSMFPRVKKRYEPLLSPKKAFPKKCFWKENMSKGQSVQQPSMMLETSEKCEVKSPGLRRRAPIAILCDLSWWEHVSMFNT